MVSCTKKRVGAVHTWPALRDLPITEVAAVATGSTSSHTITGAWPPSSMMAGFICSPASDAKRLPTGIEPVNVTNRTAGCGMRYSEISEGVPNTRLSTPGGTPASWKARTSCTAPAGVSSEAFKMMAQPEDSAPATFRAGELIGKFHGENAATTPIGWRRTVYRMPGSRNNAAIDATAFGGI